jgi:hypothetical protein
LIRVCYLEGKRSKKPDEELESVIGYSVLTLTDILSNTSHTLPVVVGRPQPGYRKSFSTASVATLLDGGKAQLKVRTSLVSTVYTQNADFNIFYKFIRGSDTEVQQSLERLRLVPTEELQRFFPTIIRELLTSMVAHSGALGVQIFKTFMFILCKLNRYGKRSLKSRKRRMTE